MLNSSNFSRTDDIDRNITITQAGGASELIALNVFGVDLMGVLRGPQSPKPGDQGGR